MTPVSPTKILFVGDMHLGRRASRIPDDVDTGGGPSQDEAGPLVALQRAVQLAINEEVQAVAFAGDLVHSERNLFEARAQLESCLAPLRENGIKIVAVAGNHDTDIMPLLAESIEGMQLLGKGGTWSACEVAPGVRLAGWSFPQAHHSESPLKQTPVAPLAGTITLGLLHADLDVSPSRYAPVASGELQDVGYDGWALGHIHAPDEVPTEDSPTRPFYLGSLSAVPPTETGAHGPVLATVKADGAITWERRTIAPLRWEHHELSVDDWAPDSLAEDGAATLRKHLYTFAEKCLPTEEPDFPLLALGLRISLTGTHTAAHALHEARQKLRGTALTMQVNNCWIFIDKVTVNVSAPLDLNELAQRQDPPGLLAGRILALESHDASVEPLVRQARQQFDEIILPHEYSDSQATSQDARQYLIKAGRQALYALLSQSTEGAS